MSRASTHNPLGSILILSAIDVLLCAFTAGLVLFLCGIGAGLGEQRGDSRIGAMPEVLLLVRPEEGNNVCLRPENDDVQWSLAGRTECNGFATMQFPEAPAVDQPETLGALRLDAALDASLTAELKLFDLRKGTTRTCDMSCSSLRSVLVSEAAIVPIGAGPSCHCRGTIFSDEQHRASAADEWSKALAKYHQRQNCPATLDICVYGAHDQSCHHVDMQSASNQDVPIVFVEFFMRISDRTQLRVVATNPCDLTTLEFKR